MGREGGTDVIATNAQPLLPGRNPKKEEEIQQKKSENPKKFGRDLKERNPMQMLSPLMLSH